MKLLNCARELHRAQTRQGKHAALFAGARCAVHRRIQVLNLISRFALEQDRLLTLVCLPSCRDCVPYGNHNVHSAANLSQQYHLDIDGLSHAAKFGKLRSGGALLSVLPQDAAGTLLELHQQWYLPLLRHHVNVLQSGGTRLSDMVAWCTTHAAECMQIGVAGQLTASCDVTPQTSVRYTLKVLKSVHDTFKY